MSVAALSVINEMVWRDALNNTELVHCFATLMRCALVRKPAATRNDLRQVLDEIVEVQWCVRPNAPGHTLWHVVVPAAE